MGGFLRSPPVLSLDGDHCRQRCIQHLHCAFVAQIIVCTNLEYVDKNVVQESNESAVLSMCHLCWDNIHSSLIG